MMMDNKGMRIRYPEFLLIAQARIEQAEPNKYWDKMFEDLFNEIPKELSLNEQDAIRRALATVRSSHNPESARKVFHETYYKMGYMCKCS